ncbi:MAG: helix-turn-helix transcriptional regulator [bacterium]|nr:helix-turn-helix transcriptional regulator [bacterium]
MAKEDSRGNWKTQLRKGFLDLCILNCLRAREFYGYDLVQELKRLEGGAMREGIIYPVLARLQDDRLVVSEKRPSSAGPPRKYYRLTKQGEKVLDDMNAHWKQMASVMNTLIRKGTEKRDE